MTLLGSRTLRALLLAGGLGLFPGCIATTNYYTGRTAPNGQWIVTPGADAILLGNPEEKDFFVEKQMPFTPSLGLARGLPRRFETGARWYYPYSFEGNLRWQVTPRSFQPFAMSANLHYGTFLVQAGYLKYGLTLSREIWRVEPFASFFLFQNGDPWNAPDEEWEDLLETSRVLSYGLAIQIPGALLVPEVDYHYKKDDYDQGFLFFGIGLRVTGEQRLSAEEQDRSPTKSRDILTPLLRR